MKIGMILDAPFPPDPRVENEAISLVEAGHEVHLFSLDIKGDKTENELLNGIHIHRYKVVKWIKKISALAYTIPIYHFYLKGFIIDFITKTGVEHLHIHDLQVARSVFWANKDFLLPVTLDLHENRPEIMRHYAHVTRFPGNILIYPSQWKQFEKKSIQQADKVVVVTIEARDYYVEKYGFKKEKFFIVPNYTKKRFYQEYEIDYRITERYKDHYVLLYLGDTGERRGINTMIAAMQKLVLKIPNIKLVIVGRSKDDPKWRKMIEELKLDKYVDLEGWQDFSKFQSYIIASDLGICPIHKNLHHETTFANKIFQSLSFGKPVIVSNCRSQAQLVKQYACGSVFEDRNIEDYSNKVIQLYSDNNLYEELSENGLKAIKTELNWEKVGKSLKKLYS